MSELNDVISELNSVAEVIRRSVAKAAADVLPTGIAPRPQIHVLGDTFDQPYIGYVVCRPYYRGHDAMAAISHLGRIAAAMCATRLVVVWEEFDLRTSILGPSDNYPNGLALLDAEFPSSHNLTWLPFDYYTSARSSTLGLSWGHPSTQLDIALPEPIPSLLTAWRAPAPFGQDGVEHTLTEALHDGYEMHFVKR
ncbi:MAG: hypothetical protein K0U76_17235 [Actinomycetia bacterium]|nr:hypothetical protein [Actinomycetes bacterium]MCH9703093.1 hypothetical protein [Actinomycetes bacterium]MCH9734966.1 hypothetical protein [Actinomycetes bacterium]